jgi:hypothetical protein
MHWLGQAFKGSRGRTLQVVVVALAVLVALRIAAPYVLTALINHQLSKPGTIQGHLGGLSLGLVRGVYDLEDLRLTALDTDGVHRGQLLEVDSLRCAIHWTPLLAGRFEGSVRFREPVLHLGPPAAEVAKQKGKPWTGEEWRRLVRSLVRFRIASITVEEGRLAYDDPKRDVHTAIGAVGGGVYDLVVPTGSDRPATFSFDGATAGRGALRIWGTARALPDKPRMELKASLEHLDLPAISSITEHYDGVVFRSGTFSGFLELLLDGDLISGTFKPIFRNLELTSYRKENGSAATKLFWSVVVPVAESVLKNSEKDQHAAMVPINGVVDDPKTDLWTIAGTALGNAFIRAIVPGFDGMGGKAQGK